MTLSQRIRLILNQSPSTILDISRKGVLTPREAHTAIENLRRRKQIKAAGKRWRGDLGHLPVKPERDSEEVPGRQFLNVYILTEHGKACLIENKGSDEPEA